MRLFPKAETDGGGKPIFGEYGRKADVHHDARARAEGGLRHAFFRTALPEQRGVAVAEHARDRDAGIEIGPEIAVARQHVRQGSRGYAEQGAQLRVPGKRAKVKKLRAACVGLSRHLAGTRFGHRV